MRALVENAAKEPGAGPLRAALKSSLHLTFLTMFAVALVNLLIPVVDLARKRAPAE